MFIERNKFIKIIRVFPIQNNEFLVWKVIIKVNFLKLRNEIVQFLNLRTFVLLS